MNKYLNLLPMSLVLILTSCAKQKNTPLAKNYYHQAIVAAEKNVREGLVIVDKSLKENPTNKALALKGTLLYQIKKYDECLPIFKKVIDNKKTSNTLRTDTMNNYACALLAAGDKAAAKKVWLELTNDRNYLSPEVAWFNLGMLEISELEGEEVNKKNRELLENAEKFFQKGIKINIDYVDCYFYLAIVLARLNRLKESKEAIVHAISISPEHTAAKDLLKQVNELMQ